MIRDIQAPMTTKELAEWQEAARLSNTEAAEVLGVDRSTFLAYKAKGNISRAVAIACRASLRDPVILEALLKPSAAPGRKKEKATT